MLDWAISPSVISTTLASNFCIRSLPSFHPCRHSQPLPVWRCRPTSKVQATQRDDDIEVAVFRFTLGIPGFDDALIPRVVGLLSLALLAVNHFAAPQPVSYPQTRIEALGALLSAVAIAAPTLQERLEELRPGRGRRAAAEAVEGGRNVFALDTEHLHSESAQQDLAWASYALLKNANVCGLFVIDVNNRIIMLRGILGEDIARDGNSTDMLQRATKSWSNTAADIKIKLNSEPLYLENRGEMIALGLRNCAIIPSGAKSLLLVPLLPLPLVDDARSKINADHGILILVGDRERALSGKEQRWAQGVAAKLHASMSNKEIM